MKNMKKANEKNIMILYRGKEDFNNDFNLKKVLSLSLYSPLLGVIVDWSCNEDLSFEV
jgi:hypothetical protein